MNDILQLSNDAYENFLHHFGLSKEEPSITHLVTLSQAFSTIPYENLTKIIKMGIEKNPARSRREPNEVINDHVRFGTGGTCFSLTTTFYSIISAAGWRAVPILADRTYGANTHSAVLVYINNSWHLLDPGYLITTPIPLSNLTAPLQIKTAFNELVFEPSPDKQKIDLYTITNSLKKYRLTFKLDPVDMGDFVKAWHASFYYEMMRYPVLTKVANGLQLYVQDNKLIQRNQHINHKTKLDQQQAVHTIAHHFGIDPSIVKKALTILKDQGEVYGSTPVS